MLVFVECKAPAVADDWAQGFFFQGFGEIINSFLVFVNLKEDVAALHEKLLVIRTLLECDVGVVQCLLVLFCSKVGLSDTIVDSNIFGAKFQSMEEVFNRLISLAKVVLRESFEKVYIGIVILNL